MDGMHPYAIDRMVEERIAEMRRLSQLDSSSPRRRRLRRPWRLPLQLASRWASSGAKAGRQTATYSAPSSSGVA
jgi:hypothetical protein